MTRSARILRAAESRLTALAEPFGFVFTRCVSYCAVTNTLRVYFTHPEVGLVTCPVDVSWDDSDEYMVAEVECVVEDFFDEVARELTLHRK